MFYLNGIEPEAPCFAGLTAAYRVKERQNAFLSIFLSSAGMDFVKLLMRKIPPLLRQDIRQRYRPVKLLLSVLQADSSCNRSYQWKWQ